MKSLNPSIFLFVQMYIYLLINNVNIERNSTMVELKLCDIKSENYAKLYHGYLELLLSNTFVFSVWVSDLDVD